MKIVDLELGIDAITLVDDFVTQGKTLLGAASRLTEAYPGSRIRAFAFIRSISQEEVDELRCPVEGKIQEVHWGTQRVP